MSFDGVGIDDNEAVDGAGRYADAGIRPAGEIGRYLRRAAGHPPLAAVTIPPVLLDRLAGYFSVDEMLSRRPKLSFPNALEFSVEARDCTCHNNCTSL